jgi:hypothetical protein
MLHNGDGSPMSWQEPLPCFSLHLLIITPLEILQICFSVTLLFLSYCMFWFERWSKMLEDRLMVSFLCNIFYWFRIEKIRMIFISWTYCTILYHAKSNWKPHFLVCFWLHGEMLLWKYPQRYNLGNSKHYFYVISMCSVYGAIKAALHWALHSCTGI